MSNIVDDLLQEVEQLEKSTQQLNDNVQDVTAHSSHLKSGDTDSIDSGLLALETAKTAQDASHQSHLAAKTALKTAEQMKAQNTELEELTHSLRQSVRTTAKDLQSAKSTITALIIGSVAANVIALSVIGYLFYETSQKSSQFKGDTLDIIQIESNLLSKKITVKVDELSSLIEAMAADIIRLRDGANLTPSSQKALLPTSNALEPNNVSNSAPSGIQAPLIDDVSVESSEQAAADDTQESVKETVKKAAGNTAIETSAKEVKLDQSAAHSKTNASETHTDSTLATAPTAINTPLEYSELKTLVEKILSEQQKLQAIALAGANTGNLDPQHVKKLNDISWLVRKQEKALKELQASLTNGSVNSGNSTTLSASLSELKIQLRLLTEQQLSIQNQVKTLQIDLKKYASDPPPYSYKAK